MDVMASGPNPLAKLGVAAGQNIRKLIKDGFVIRKPAIIHSRSRARTLAEAKGKGRHTGYGKCLGMANIACSSDPACIKSRGHAGTGDARTSRNQAEYACVQASAVEPVRHACPPRSCGCAAPVSGRARSARAYKASPCGVHQQSQCSG